MKRLLSFIAFIFFLTIGTAQVMDTTDGITFDYYKEQFLLHLEKASIGQMRDFKLGGFAQVLVTVNHFSEDSMVYTLSTEYGFFGFGTIISHVPDYYLKVNNEIILVSSSPNVSDSLYSACLGLTRLRLRDLNTLYFDEYLYAEQHDLYSRNLHSNCSKVCLKNFTKASKGVDCDVDYRETGFGLWNYDELEKTYIYHRYTQDSLKR